VLNKPYVQSITRQLVYNQVFMQILITANLITVILTDPTDN